MKIWKFPNTVNIYDKVKMWVAHFLFWCSLSFFLSKFYQIVHPWKVLYLSSYQKGDETMKCYCCRHLWILSCPNIITVIYCNAKHSVWLSGVHSGSLPLFSRELKITKSQIFRIALYQLSNAYQTKLFPFLGKYA